jgi:formate hydrogenlyase subunit 4
MEPGSASHGDNPAKEEIMRGLPEVLLYSTLNLAVVLLVSPLYDGIIRKVTAVVQSRKGPPVTQSYMDLMKLLIKEDIEVGDSPGMQRFSALLSVSAILSVTLLIPVGAPAPLSGYADAILLIYLLTLTGISVLLAGLAAGSTYSLVGMSREMMAMMTLEPLMAIAIIMSAVRTDSLRLDSVFGGSVYLRSDGHWSGILILGVLAFGLQAFIGRVPFDATEAETEIMEGPLLEYSGPKLALFKFARMAKLFVYTALFLAVFVPRIPTGNYVLDLLVFLVEQAVLLLVVTVIAAPHARYRIDQVVRYYVVLFVLALGALTMAALGS